MPVNRLFLWKAGNDQEVLIQVPPLIFSLDTRVNVFVLTREQKQALLSQPLCSTVDSWLRSATCTRSCELRELKLHKDRMCYFAFTNSSTMPAI
jgi:hypothetical protein